ncbi:hypothetical protein D1007_12345 [Hordeum vulgare]|nr:hypothetical protein D1007_12345 [Hordeum vulgare]
MYVREEIDGIVDMGCVASSLDFFVHMPELHVNLVYSQPKVLLLACKEVAATTVKIKAAGAPATGRNWYHVSGEPCAVCINDEDTWNDDKREAVTLLCSHAFDSGCKCATSRVFTGRRHAWHAGVSSWIASTLSHHRRQQSSLRMMWSKTSLITIIGFLAHGAELVGPHIQMKSSSYFPFLKNRVYRSITGYGHNSLHITQWGANLTGSSP